MFRDNLRDNLKRITRYLTKNTIVFWSSIYVFLGGVVVCNMYPNDLLYGDWWFWAWLITLPTNIVSYAFRYTGDIGCFEVFVIQILMLLPIYIILKRIKKKGN